MSNKYTYKPPCDEETLRSMYETMTQTECAAKLGVSQKVVFTAMRRFGIKSRKAAPRNQKRENNNNWRGESAGKSAFHRRLYAKFGKPQKCSQCGTEENGRSYDYANLSGRYDDESDYAAMCRSCHWRYDKKINNIKKMRRDAGG